MCLPSPKQPAVKPVAAAPVASPVIIDEAATQANDDLRRKRRAAYGRQSTILAGASGAVGAPTTSPVKTATGQ